MTAKGETNIKAEVAKARETKPRTRKGKLDDLPPHLKLYIIRELAIGTPNTEIAPMFDVSPQAIWAFKKRYANEIEAQSRDLTDEFAAMWIADKRNRIMAYEGEYERLNDAPNADHHLWSIARQAALKNVAEELGQLPNRNGNVQVNVVQHIVEGIDLENLR